MITLRFATVRVSVLITAVTLVLVIAQSVAAAPITNEQLVVQVNRAKANGWAPLFTKLEQRYGLQKGILFAIASRETNMSDVVGDGGHGRGVFQIDDRSHKGWLCDNKACAAGTVPPVGAAAAYAARILRSHYDRALALGVPRDKAWKFATSAYNAGFTGALNGYKQGNSDLFTAGRDYGKDVQAHRRVIVGILAYQSGSPRAGIVAVPKIELDARSIVPSHGYQAPARIVLHSTEGDVDGLSYLWAIGKYWAPRGYGCQIAVAKDGSTARYVDDDEIGWCVAGYNTGSLSIEQVGFARFTRAQWLARPAQLLKVAKWIAYWSKKYDIPIVRSVTRGVLTHAEATKYKQVTGGHTDPGAGYPFDYVLRLARQQFTEGNPPAVDVPVLRKVATTASVGGQGQAGRWQVVRSNVLVFQGAYRPALAIYRDKLAWARRVNGTT